MHHLDFGQHGNPTLVSGEIFKSLMRNIACSVAVVTTNGAGRPHGMTATAICSVCAEPATILIVVNRSARSHPILSANRTFTINVLAEHQSDLGARFSSNHESPFSGVEYLVGSIGTPVIKDVAAYIECAITTEVDVGTHTIFIARVVGGDVSRALPLIYHMGEYKSLSPRSSDGRVAAMFLERWSPRAFAEFTIEDQTLMSFFEAARWAPSSMNAQPWRFVYARPGSPGWQSFLDSLSNTNRSWARNASALIAFVSKRTLEFGGKEIESPTHSFDTGAAWMSFALQAHLSGWHTHGMAGFDGERLRRSLAIPDGFTIEAVAAIGKVGSKEDLPETLKVREGPSARKPLADLVFNETYGAK